MCWLPEHMPTLLGSVQIYSEHGDIFGAKQNMSMYWSQYYILHIPKFNCSTRSIKVIYAFFF